MLHIYNATRWLNSHHSYGSVFLLHAMTVKTSSNTSNCIRCMHTCTWYSLLYLVSFSLQPECVYLKEIMWCCYPLIQMHELVGLAKMQKRIYSKLFKSIKSKLCTQYIRRSVYLLWSLFTRVNMSLKKAEGKVCNFCDPKFWIGIHVSLSEAYLH